MGITTYPLQAPKQYVTVQLTASGTFSVPATTTMVDVLLISGGAGGAGTTRPTTASSANYVQGGAPGCVMYIPNFPATPSSTISYTIGTGGAGAVASGTVSASFAGSAGGNTTFGSLVAPGAGVKVGSLGATASTVNRGGFGIYAGYPGSYDNQFLPASSTATWAGQDPAGLGFPIGLPNAYVAYCDYYVYNTSNARNIIYPSHVPGAAATQTAAGDTAHQANFVGITKSFSRLLQDFTAPTGSTGTIASGCTSGAIPSGWNGNGGYGNGGGASTQGFATGYGAGGGGVYGLVANAHNGAGGAAAANSGSGGGGAAATSGGAGAVVLSNGGAGGSGVIFLGYWA
jgi:hypothetical protein